MTNCREYGKPPYSAIVVHGGPGAPGSCAGICRGLADAFGVLEHLQQGNTITELVEELRDVILRYDLQKTVLIGHSWGAWLSFIFAAQYPQHVSKVILVGCGPFDVKTSSTASEFPWSGAWPIFGCMCWTSAGMTRGGSSMPKALFLH